jgi:hypothetical protein
MKLITYQRPETRPGRLRERPPAFYINDRGGCIGRFLWINTTQKLHPQWSDLLFPLWGSSHWFRP